VPSGLVVPTVDIVCMIILYPILSIDLGENKSISRLRNQLARIPDSHHSLAPSEE